QNAVDVAGSEGIQKEAKPVTYTVGGVTRAESVRRGLAASAGEIVLIHDGARPMIRDSYVTHCVEAMADFPGATMAVRSKDTIKLGDDRDVVTATTERPHTWVVQTPQCFRRKVLEEAHERYGSDPGITDDCMLLELCGQDVKLVEGDYTNIKVTTPEDLTLAEAFLRRMGDSD
ncbi:MAG: 2-C-methyl-D-erythritol 4-phosphate cytidylyltransferase, partial [Clostridiales bacterium]|nr:2-C-methyl-D-erythritol 4-phosphate cytidylyltransferase [Clostridiales bacterium]